MDELVLTLHRYAAGAWRRRWLGLAAAWIICLVGWAAVMKLPATYEATAEVYVAADPVLTPLLHGIAIGTGIDTEFELLRQTLLSRPNMETLIDKADLLPANEQGEARDALIKKLADTIRILPQTDSLFSIAYSNANPKRAYTVVQTLLAIFIDRANGSNQSDLANAQRFLDGQLVYYQDKLRGLEKRRADFLAKYIELLPGADGNVSQYDAAGERVRTLQGQLQDAQARQSMLEAELKKTSPMLVASSDVAGGGPGVNPALAEAEQHLLELRQKFTDAYPGVIAAEQAVRALSGQVVGGGKAGLSSVQKSVPNPVYDQLKLQLIDASTSVFSLTRELKDATAEQGRLAALARTVPGLQAEYTNLNRNYEVLRKQYEELLLRKESMQITTAANLNANRVQLEVVNPPVLPKIPVAPRRKLLLVGVLVVGIGGGLGLALLLAHADTSCYTLQDLRAIGVPVAGSISLNAPPQQKAGLLHFMAFGAGLVLLGAAFAQILLLLGRYSGLA